MPIRYAFTIVFLLLAGVVRAAVSLPEQVRHELDGNKDPDAWPIAATIVCLALWLAFVLGKKSATKSDDPWDGKGGY